MWAVVGVCVESGPMGKLGMSLLLETSPYRTTLMNVKLDGPNNWEIAKSAANSTAQFNVDIAEQKIENRC